MQISHLYKEIKKKKKTPPPESMLPFHSASTNNFSPSSFLFLLS